MILFVNTCDQMDLLQKHPGLPDQNTRVFYVSTPGCTSAEHPGVPCSGSFSP